MKKFLLTFLILFSISFCFAFEDYKNLGGKDYIYYAGDGFFNSGLDLDDVESATRSITSPRYAPIVADFDNDSTLEIAVWDGSSIEIYSSKTLVLEDAFDTKTSRTSPMIGADIDGDSVTEIIFIDEVTGNVSVIAYNSSTLVQQEHINISFTPNPTKPFVKSMVGCSEKNGICLGVIQQENTHSSSHFLKGQLFNTSAVVGSAYTTSNGNQFLNCLSDLQTITVADYNNDDVDDFLYGAYVIDNTGGAEETQIHIVQYIDPISAETILDFTHTNWISSSEKCNRSVPTIKTNAMVTPILVSDFDGSLANGREISFSTKFYSDDYYAYIIDENGNELQKESIVNWYRAGNPVSASAWTDTSSDDDVCFPFFRKTTDDDAMFIQCISEQTISSKKERGWFFNHTYNLTLTNHKFWSNLVHSSSQTTTSGDTSELITSYGTIRLRNVGDADVGFNENLACTLGLCNTDLIYENERGESTVVPIDYFNFDRLSYLYLTETNLWFINDGFSKTGCDGQDCIGEVTMNPCGFDQTVKVNETMEFTVVGSDIDSDQVQARVIVYANESAEQDSGWTGAGASGTTFAIGGFTANQSTTNSKIKVFVTDSDNNHVTEEEYTFSVSTKGVGFGECTSTVGGVVTDEDEEGIIDADQLVTNQDNNTIINTVKILNDPSKSGIGQDVFWLILTLIAIVAVAVKSDFNNSVHTLVAVSITAVIMVGLGVVLGFLGIGWMIIISIIPLAIVGIFGVKAFFSNSGGG